MNRFLRISYASNFIMVSEPMWDMGFFPVHPRHDQHSLGFGAWLGRHAQQHSLGLVRESVGDTIMKLEA